MTWYSSHAIARRGDLSRLIIWGVLGLLLLAFFKVQVLGSSRYRLASEDNRLRPIPIPAARGLITEAVAEQRAVPNRPQQLADVAKRLRDLFLDRQLADLKLRMLQPDLVDAERGELLKQQKTLRDLKGQPLAPLTPGAAF